MIKRLLFVSLLCNVVIGIAFLMQQFLPAGTGGQSLPVNREIQKFRYLSPRILQEYKNDTLINFLPLRRSIHERVRPFGETFAVYFEYLPTGTSIGVNEKKEYLAASLIKVPVVMAHFREKEHDEAGMVDDEHVMLTLKEGDIDPLYGELWKKGVGARVSMDDAVSLALRKSDNTAVMAIAHNTKQEHFDAVYEGVDIDWKMDQENTVIAAKSFSSILKALYFSAVLSKESSQAILEHMTKTDFFDKLPAGVPKGVPVAHKIGSYNNESFSDCGIVYQVKRPYILCMISQSSEDEARSRMKRVSKEVYNFVSNANSLK